MPRVRPWALGERPDSMRVQVCLQRLEWDAAFFKNDCEDGGKLIGSIGYEWSLQELEMGVGKGRWAELHCSRTRYVICGRNVGVVGFIIHGTKVTDRLRNVRNTRASAL
jgi:hypothetical protein